MAYDEKARARALQLLNDRRARQGLPAAPALSNREKLAAAMDRVVDRLDAEIAKEQSED